MGFVDHSLSEVPVGHAEWSPEDTFPALDWYFEQPLWVRDALVPGNAAHNYPLAVRIRGPLNQESLECSLQEVLRRHRVLRSVFRIVDGKLTQMIMPLQPLTIRVMHLSDLSETEREAKAQQLVIEDATRPFTLTNGPMLRTVLLRLAAEDHILLLITHHIVCDDWSTGILLRELFALYDAFNSGNPPSLPELSYQYGDFVRSVQQRLQHKDLDSRFAFWRECLAGGNNFHHVPTDHLRPSHRTFRGTNEKAIFSEEISNSVKLLGQRERVSPFMIMLAVLQSLLQRYCGDDDIGVGSCVANRPLLQMEGVIGPFANVTVLRTNLSGNPTFREMLRRVREVSLTAYSYQDLPFGRLVANLQPTPDPSRNPLFQVLFVLLNAPNGLCQSPRLAIEPYPLDTGTTRYELNMWVRIRERLEVDLQYNSDLFEASTAHQILQDYNALLETMSKDPEARAADVGMPSKIESKGLATRGSRRLDLVTTHDDVHSKLAEIWKSTFGQQAIGMTGDFFQLGGTSLQAVHLFAKIEETFGVKLPLSTLLRATTIKDLSEAIRKGDTAAQWSCLVEIQPGGSRPPLFCAHGQSGNLLVYRSLAQYLGSDQPVYGLQPQGLDGKRPPLACIEDMATDYVKAILAIQAQGPYFLVGYCMGGTIALEIAQQLRKQGHSVGLLAFLETYNWGKAKPTSLARSLYYYGQKWWFSGKHFLLMTSRNKLSSLQTRFYELRNKSELSECNMSAALSYIPKMYPGRILHVCPVKQYAEYDRAEMGWKELAVEGVEPFFLSLYPGQMFEEPFVRNLAAKLRDSIDEAVQDAERTPSEPLKLTLKGLPNRHPKARGHS
jgi:acyl carrier protein